LSCCHTLPASARLVDHWRAQPSEIVNPPVVADLDTERDHDFPGVAVGIAEIAGVTAVIGLVCGLQ